MSDPQEEPREEEGRVEAEGVDPDIPTTHPEQSSPAEEEEDDERIDVEDLP